MVVLLLRVIQKILSVMNVCGCGNMFFMPKKVELRDGLRDEFVNVHKIFSLRIKDYRFVVVSDFVNDWIIPFSIFVFFVLISYIFK